MALVSYDVATDHLLRSGLPWDADLMAKIEQASALVLIHLKRSDTGWNENTDPSTDPEFAIVQAAVLKVLGNLYRFRGDDDRSPNPLDDSVLSMLSMLRDPAVA